MLPVFIKRQRFSTVDPKELLRIHVDQLPPHKQREFVVEAFKLITARSSLSTLEPQMEAYNLHRQQDLS